MASTEKRLTKAEIRKSHQDGCKEISCSSPGLCPFCPNVKNIILEQGLVKDKNRMREELRGLERQLDCKSGNESCTLYESTGVPCYRHVWHTNEVVLAQNSMLVEALEKIEELMRLPERMQQSRCYRIAAAALKEMEMTNERDLRT